MVQSSLLAIQYEPFHSRFRGDHRAMTADFDTNLLFRNEVPTPGIGAPRSIKSNDRRNVVHYVQELYDHAIAQNIPTHLKQLLDSGVPATGMAYGPRFLTRIL